MEADFQQWYGLDLTSLGSGLAPARAARLAMQLPRDARIWLHLSTDGRDQAHIWTPSYRLLAEMHNNLAWLCWSHTRDAEKNPAGAPARYLPPEVRDATDGDFAAAEAEYERIMRDIERRGVEVSG